MIANITLSTRREPLPIDDEAKLRAIVAAVANQTGEEFRVRRPSPDSRKRVVVFTTSEVLAIDANGINLMDMPSPMSTGEVAA